MNPCPPTGRLELLLGEGLTVAEREEVTAHLEACTVCQQELERLSATTAAAAPARAGLEPRPEFLTQLKHCYPLLTGAEPRAETPAAWPDVPDYEVLGVLGRGATAVVYKARQRGLNRIVALKVILGGEHAGPAELSRFRAEAEMVARLQHPNIVQIHEVGEHRGLPFFSLEFCPGGTLAQRLNGTPLEPIPAAELVEVLARAVHHAHQNGVVHRDLKPANILLSLSRAPEGSASDAPPSGARLNDTIPKIADFGLARRLDVAGRTATGAVMGTPSYMAPEQAQGRTREVGPATDVYALGAILYELLAARPPFQAPQPLETMLLVVSQDAVPPRSFQPSLPRDLETICLKCLRKEAPRRYPSAWDLAEDLRRFRAGEPIRARPVGPLARLGRWCRRRPAVAGLLAALVVVVLGALGIMTWLWLRAERQRDLAETSSQEARLDFQLARESVDDYATRVSNSLKLRQDDLRPLRKELLETVVPFYEKLLARHSDNPDVQAERGAAYARLAAITREIENPAKACTLYEQAAAIFETLSEQHPDDGNYPVRLANLRTELSETYQKVDRHADAEAGFQAGLKLWQRLIEEHPGEVKYQLGLAQARIGLAGVYGATGRRDVAVAEYQRALQIQEELERQGAGIPAEQQRAFARGHLNLGLLFSQAGQKPQAEDQLKQALKIQEDLLRQDPHVSDYTQDLSKTRMSLGELYWKTDRLTRAEGEFLEAMRLSEELVRRHPSVLQYPEYLADSRDAFAKFYVAIKQPSKGVEEWKKALDDLEALPPAARDLTANQERLAAIHASRGQGLWMIGKQPEAVLEYREAIRVLTALRDRHPTTSSYQKSLMDSRTGLGQAHVAARQFGEAQAEFRNALTISEALAPQDFEDREVQSKLSRCYNELAILYYATQRKTECAEAIRKSLEIDARLARQYPDFVYYQTGVAKGHNNLAVVHVDQGRPKEGMEEYRQALAITERLVREHPRVIEYSVMLGTYNANLGILQRNNGDWETALDTFALAIKTLEGVLEKEPQHARAKTLLCNAHEDRARTLSKLARLAPALSDWQRALDLDDGKRRIGIRAGRAVTLAQSGDHAGAMAEVEALAGDKDVKPGAISRLGFACAHASVAVGKDDKLPAGERADLAERYAARAVVFLSQAHAGGHLKSAMFLQEFKTDTDLDPLRKRADFQKLLAEVESGAKDGEK